MRIKPSLVLKRRLLLIVSLVSLALMFSGALNAQTGKVIAHDAWVRMPLPSKMDAAAFMMLENHTPQSRSVVSVSTDAAASAELHQMHMEKMVMVMTPVAQISIPSNGKTSLDPNGFHIMLFGLKTKPAVGDKITLTLKLDDGSTVPVEAIFRKN